jgi:hypothetical protein
MLAGAWQARLGPPTSGTETTMSDDELLGLIATLVKVLDSRDAERLDVVGTKDETGRWKVDLDLEVARDFRFDLTVGVSPVRRPHLRIDEPPPVRARPADDPLRQQAPSRVSNGHPVSASAPWVP